MLLNDRKFNVVLNTYVCSVHKNQDNILTGCNFKLIKRAYFRIMNSSLLE